MARDRKPVIGTPKTLCVREMDQLVEWLLKDGSWFLRHFFLLTDTGKVILRLHPDTLRNKRAALKGMRAALDRGEITMDNVRQHYQSFIAQAEYSSGDGAIRDMDRFYTLTF